MKRICFFCAVLCCAAILFACTAQNAPPVQTVAQAPAPAPFSTPAPLVATDAPRPEPTPFRMIVLNDTQHYGGTRGEIFLAMADWIAEEAGKGDIACVIHSGDIYAGNGEVGAAALRRIADAAPLLAVAGNHDAGMRTQNYSRYLRLTPSDGYLPEQLYKNGKARYLTFTAQDTNFIVIGGGWIIGKDEAAWMRDVLLAHPDHYAIVVSHSYFYAGGQRTETGERLYQNVVLPCLNVRMTICGHKHTAFRKETPVDDDGDGRADRVVYEMISNYQDMPNGGNGYLRIFTVDTAYNTVAVDTYSPYVDEHVAFTKKPREEQFVLKTNFAFARARD